MKKIFLVLLFLPLFAHTQLVTGNAMIGDVVGGQVVGLVKQNDYTTMITATGGSSYRTKVELLADVVNSNAVANTLADVTGLSFNVVSGTTYRFYALIPYTSAATTTGSRWTINAPASTLLAYTSTYCLTASTQTFNFGSVVGFPAAANASSLLLGNVAIIQGVIKPSANGTFVIRFASEILNSAITAKAGATLEYW